MSPEIRQLKGENSSRDNRICFIIDDVDKKLRLLQSKLRQNKQESISFSQVINYALRKSQEK